MVSFNITSKTIVETEEGIDAAVQTYLNSIATTATIQGISSASVPGQRIAVTIVHLAV